MNSAYDKNSRKLLLFTGFGYQDSVSECRSKPYYKDTKKMVPVQHFRDVLFLLSKEEEDTVTFFRKRHSE